MFKIYIKHKYFIHWCYLSVTCHHCQGSVFVWWLNKTWVGQIGGWFQILNRPDTFNLSWASGSPLISFPDLCCPCYVRDGHRYRCGSVCITNWFLCCMYLPFFKFTLLFHCSWIVQASRDMVVSHFLKFCISVCHTILLWRFSCKLQSATQLPLPVLLFKPVLLLYGQKKSSC